LGEKSSQCGSSKPRRTPKSGLDVDDLSVAIPVNYAVTYLLMHLGHHVLSNVLLVLNVSLDKTARGALPTVETK
jgi:hypothetical protein